MPCQTDYGQLGITMETSRKPKAMIMCGLPYGQLDKLPFVDVGN